MTELCDRIEDAIVSEMLPRIEEQKLFKSFPARLRGVRGKRKTGVLAFHRVASRLVARLPFTGLIGAIPATKSLMLVLSVSGNLRRATALEGDGATIVL